MACASRIIGAVDRVRGGELDYVVWARITHSGPQEFVVTVSAVVLEAPNRYSGSAEDFQNAVARSREEALVARDRLLTEFMNRIGARGDNVVEVERD